MSSGYMNKTEPIDTFYQQPGAWKAAEEYQAKGYFTRVGRWKGEWALWVEKKVKIADVSTGSTTAAEVIDG